MKYYFDYEFAIQIIDQDPTRLSLYIYIYEGVTSLYICHCARVSEVYSILVQYIVSGENSPSYL